MGVALGEDGHRVGLLQPKKVQTYIVILCGFEESDILIGPRAVRKNS